MYSTHESDLNLPLQRNRYRILLTLRICSRYTMTILESPFFSFAPYINEKCSDNMRRLAINFDVERKA